MTDLVRIALCALFPRVEDVPGLAELGVDSRIAQLRRECSAFLWAGLVASAVLFYVTPVLTVGRPVVASALTTEQLDNHAHALATHRVYLVRQLVTLLKLFGGMFWGDAAEVRGLARLPPLPPDPGTRRTEALVARPRVGARTLPSALVALAASSTIPDAESRYASGIGVEAPR